MRGLYLQKVNASKTKNALLKVANELHVCEGEEKPEKLKKTKKNKTNVFLSSSQFLRASQNDGDFSDTYYYFD